MNLLNNLSFLFALFVIVPLIEIYLLISIGGAIGALSTIGLVVFTALLGAWMLRKQSMAALKRVRDALDEGKPPARELLEGVILLIGGALLLTPGFVTDALGFICLLPPTRHWLLTRLTRRILTKYSANFTTPNSGARIIEGEWKREGD